MKKRGSGRADAVPAVEWNKGGCTKLSSQENKRNRKCGHPGQRQRHHTVGVQGGRCASHDPPPKHFWQIIRFCVWRRLLSRYRAIAVNFLGHTCDTETRKGMQMLLLLLDWTSWQEQGIRMKASCMLAAVAESIPTLWGGISWWMQKDNKLGSVLKRMKSDLIGSQCLIDDLHL